MNFKKLIVTAVLVCTAVTSFAQYRWAKSPQYINNTPTYEVFQVLNETIAMAINYNTSISVVEVFIDSTVLYEGLLLEDSQYYVYLIGSHTYIRRDNTEKTVPIYFYVPVSEYTKETADLRVNWFLELIKADEQIGNSTSHS